MKIKKTMSLGIVCLLIVSVFGMAIARVDDGYADEFDPREEIQQDDHDYVDHIRMEVRMDTSVGVGDTATGVLDAYLQPITGSFYEDLPGEWKDDLSTLDSYGSYNEFSFNPAYTEKSGVEVDIDGEGNLMFNPFAIEDVRYASNWLLNRSYVVDEIYEGYALPQYQAIGQFNPDYQDELAPIDDEHGLEFEGDFDKAYGMIQDAMGAWVDNPDLEGDLRAPDDGDSDFWEYRPVGGDWAPVEIEGLIRIDDIRHAIGLYFSDLLEDAHIKVDRNMADNSLINTWLFTDPADFEWGFYTGGWVASSVQAYQHATPVHMYTDYWPYMPGGIDGHSNRYYHLRDEPYAQDLLEEWATPLMANRFEDEEEYWDAVRHISDMGIEKSMRTFVSTEQTVYVLNRENVGDITADSATGWSQVFSPRTIKTLDGTLNTAVTSSGYLYSGPWNNIDGSLDYRGSLQQRTTKDFATHLDPTHGTPIPMRAEWTEIQRDYEYDEDGELITNLAVPDNDDVWFYDVQEEEWLNGGYTYEPIFDEGTQIGAELVERDTAATAVTYDYHLGTWHSGHELTIQDILAWNSFSKQLAFGPEWGALGEQHHHGSWGSGTRNDHLNTVAIEIVDEEEGIVTFYGDHTSPIDEEIGGYYADLPEVPWQLYEAATHLRGATEFADSSNTTHEIYEWSYIEDTNQVHWLRNAQTLDFKNTLQNMADDGWIPSYLTHGPTPITETELVDEINAIRSFQDEYDHSWVTQGPFKLTDYDSANLVMEFDRWNEEDGYPFPPGGNQLVHDWEDLHGVRNDLDGHYTLMNDLTPDCDGYHEYASENADDGSGWLPLGDDTQAFEGTFQGNGHDISGLYIDRPNTDHVGLFGCIGSDGEVNDVGVDAEVSGDRYVGGLIGENRGLVSNSYATGDVYGSGGTVGGLVGFNQNGGTIKNASAHATVIGDISYTGGLVGHNRHHIYDSFATGNVVGTNDVGGLVGYNRGLDPVILRCYATGDIGGTLNGIGGFVGSNHLGADISDSYSTGNVIRLSGTFTNYGGFVGRNAQARIVNCYSTGQVIYEDADDPTDKGFSGNVDTSGDYEMSGNFWDVETSEQISTAGDATGKSTVEMMTEGTFTEADWDFDDVWHMVEETTYPLLWWQELPLFYDYVDHIRIETREELSDGFYDTASGDLDVFLESIDGETYDGFDESMKDQVETLDSYGSYTELSFNSAWTEDSGVELDTVGDGNTADIVFNPLALREVRYATNWLLSREHIVEDIYNGYGIPQYQAINMRNPVYDEELGMIEDEHGITYEGDYAYAYNMIQDAMEDAMDDLAGELRSPSDSPTDFWQYQPPGETWMDVEIKGLIREDDQRLEIGHYFADLLEANGIKVERIEGDSGLISDWLFSDPADFEWGFYTGGWLASMNVVYQHSVVCQFYTDHFPYMPGGINGHANRYYHLRDEPYAQELLDDWATPLMDGQFENEEEYWDAVRHITDVGVEQSMRVFIDMERELITMNKDGVADVATDAVTGWSQVYSPRTVQTAYADLMLGQRSTDLYMSNWNIIGGSACYHSNMQQKISRDFATDLHPQDGDTIPMRADFMDENGEMMVQRDYKFDQDGDLLPNIPIPDNDDVWFYDVQDHIWMNGGYTYEQTNGDADLISRDLAATAVTYDFSETLGTWHSGHEFTLRDIVAWMAFNKQLSFDEDWGAVGDQYFHQWWGNANRPRHLNTLAWEIDVENQQITVYGDYVNPHDSDVAGYYMDIPEVPWQLFEAASHLRGATGYADSSNTPYEIYEWSDIEDTNQVHWLDPDQTLDFIGTLDNLASVGWIPNYLTHGPTPMTTGELVDEIDAIQGFQDEYGHSWISQGPFMITVHDTGNNVMEYERWTQEDGYPFPVDHWEEMYEMETFNMELTADEESDGWNFVSFNLDVLETDLATILEEIEGSYTNVMYYDAETDSWYSYVPGRAEHFNNLDSWDHTMGIWIQMDEDATLTVEGVEPTKTDITLYPGWNMVGIPAENAGNHGLPEEVDRIAYFDASDEYNLAYDHEPEQFIFEPGQGYQIYNAAEEPVTWTVSYPSAFVSTWNTENSGVSNDDQIQLPLEESGTYDFTVDWGDGSIDHITRWNQSEVTHTYDEPGIYTVSITGTIQGWRFNNGGDRRGIIEISQWGPLNFGNSGDYFRGCLNLELIAIDAPDLTGTTTLESAFQGTYLGSAGDMNEWDVSGVTNMEDMFRESNFDQRIGEWDVSSVIRMNYMFGMSPFNQDISGWDVSNVEDMTFLFRLCSSFNQDISGWDVSSATNMYGMFYSATSFDQDLGEWNVSDVSNMGNMLRDTALSTPNYDSLLMSWSELDLQHGVDFHAGDTQYSSGEPADARQYIIDEFGWSITDGGEA